jgi:hypothetical protein
MNTLSRCHPDIIRYIAKMLKYPYVYCLKLTCKCFNSYIPKFRSDMNFITQVAGDSYLNLIKWGIEHKFRISHHTFTAACLSNKKAIIDYIRKIGGSPCLDTFETLAERGYLHTIKDIIKIRHVTEELLNYIYRGATKGHRINILEWLYKDYSGIKIPIQVIMTAAYNGFNDIIKWAYDRDVDSLQGTTFYDPIDAAARGGKLHTLIYLIELGLVPTQTTYISACNGNHIEIVKWLLDKNYQLRVETIYDLILKRNYYMLNEMIKYGARLSNLEDELHEYTLDDRILNQIYQFQSGKIFETSGCPS